MERRHTVTALRNGTYIHDLYLVWIRLHEDSPDYVFCSFHIGFQGLFRKIISSRRDHSSDMEHEISSGYPLQHILIIQQITPHDSH